MQDLVHPTADGISPGRRHLQLQRRRGLDEEAFHSSSFHCQQLCYVLAIYSRFSLLGWIAFDVRGNQQTYHTLT